MKRTTIAVSAFTFISCSAEAAETRWEFTVVDENIVAVNGVAAGFECLGGYVPPAGTPLPNCVSKRGQAPYGLAELITTTGPAAVYIANYGTPNPPIDDKNVISFMINETPSGPAYGLELTCDFPAQPIPGYPSYQPLEPNAFIKVYSQNGKLSGTIQMQTLTHGTGTLSMTGTNNMWTGYWYSWMGAAHEITAVSKLR